MCRNQDEPPDDEMQRTSQGWDGGSPLISVLGVPRHDAPRRLAGLPRDADRPAVGIE